MQDAAAYPVAVRERWGAAPRRPEDAPECAARRARHDDSEFPCRIRALTNRMITARLLTPEADSGNRVFGFSGSTRATK